MNLIVAWHESPHHAIVSFKGDQGLHQDVLDLHADAQGLREADQDLHVEESVIAPILLGLREGDLSLHEEGRTLRDEPRNLHEDTPDLPRQCMR